jgi:hypothetical protein
MSSAAVCTNSPSVLIVLFTVNYEQDEEGDKNAQWAIDKPHLFVMKPQREGGGKFLHIRVDAFEKHLNFKACKEASRLRLR